MSATAAARCSATRWPRSWPMPASTVTREYYVNDGGAQVETLARSLHLRYREALGETIGAIPEGLYPGDYLIPPAQEIARARRRPVARLRRSRMAARVRAHRRRGDDGADPGRPRRARRASRRLHLRARADRRAAGSTRRCRSWTAWGCSTPAPCRRPRAKPPEDWEPVPQLLFRSTAFGDEIDRPLKRSNGAWTYFAADLAYHLDKFRRGFALMVDVWGADHGGYVKRMQAAVRALTQGEGTLDIRLCQLVNLLDGGKPLKMSKRAGRIVTLRDVVDEVGARRRPLHHADPQERRAARFRPRQGHRAVEGQPGLLRPVRPRADLLGVAQCARGRGRATARPRRSISACWPIRRSWRCCARWRRSRACWRVRPSSSSRTGSPSTCTTWPAPSTACGRAATRTRACGSCRRTMPR